MPTQTLIISSFELLSHFAATDAAAAARYAASLRFRGQLFAFSFAEAFRFLSYYFFTGFAAAAEYAAQPEVSFAAQPRFFGRSHCAAAASQLDEAPRRRYEPYRLLISRHTLCQPRPTATEPRRWLITPLTLADVFRPFQNISRFRQIALH
jgi:hypothetical protein